MKKKTGKLLVSLVMMMVCIVLFNVSEVKAETGTYTVVFNGNGATSGKMDNQTMEIDTEAAPIPSEFMMI